MVKYIIPIALLVFAVSQLQAQRPTSVIVNGSLGKPSTARQKAPCGNAGTIRFSGVVRGQSNDVTPDTIYLCFGDETDITHNRNAVFSGDPVPSTPAGVGYGFYNCRPTIDGPNAATIATDSCQVKTPPPTQGPYYIAAGSNLQGDITLQNDGFLQDRFNGGNPALWWFAPITYDALTGGQANYESTGGGAVGSCVSARVDQAFAVVYLNAVEATNINTNVGASGCSGSFRVSGGLPEFDSNTPYTVDISLDSDPSIKGRIDNVPRHDSLVQFFVPQAGTYTVTIEDGKSCGTSFQVNMSGCTAVTFTLPAVSALPGDNICVDVTVQNFDSIGSMQFSMSWDPEVVRFASVGGFNPALTGLTTNQFNVNSGAGTLALAWFNTNLNGVTLPDSSAIFEVCFNVIGALGEDSPLQFTNNPTGQEIGRIRPGGIEQLGFIGRNGIISLTTDIIIPLVERDSVSCPDAMNGAFTVAFFGGRPPYSMQYRALNPPGTLSAPIPIPSSGTNVRIDNLAAGEYEIVVSDSDTPVNTTTDTIRIEQGPQLGISLVPTQPTCFGDSTGSVRAVVILDGVEQSNPENRFTFTWNRPVNGNVSALNSIPFGNYAVTVTDRNGCSESASLTLSQPPRITVTPTINNATCTGAQNGSINLAVTGGIPAYTLRWSDDTTANVANRPNLNPGQYRVTITDQNSCVREFGPYNVGAIKTLSIETNAIDSVSCNGANDGLIRVTGRTSGPGEALPYNFTWQGPGAVTPTNTPTTSALTNIGAGTYILTMSDSDPQNCQVVDTFAITEPAPLEVTLASQQNETCGTGNDGAATITVTGGTFPYTYAWTGGQNDSTATNLSAGQYVATVRDANNCVDSLEVTITAPTPPTIAPIAPDTVSCTNSTDGNLSASATPVPGTSITSYRWSNGQTTQSINGLSPGIYTITVTASDGCINVDSAIVLSPPPVVIDSIASVSPTCAGFDNGRLTVFASGGTAPYRYTWDNGTLNANVRGQLRAGSYVVTVIDANNCAPAIDTGVVTDPPTIDITFSAIEGVSCFENTCDGSATATAIYSNGTTGTFTFAWASSEVETNTASSTATQLCAGNQIVAVTDANNCSSIDTVNVPSPPAITVQLDVQPVSCNSFSDGRITLNPAGGVPPFTFQWVENGDTDNTVDNLMAGIYNAIITDSNGCTKTQIVELDEPAELQLALDLNSTTPSVSCSGDNDGRITVTYNSNDSINPVGPTPFTWSNNVADPASPTALNLAPGTYSVTLTDVKGCTDTLSFTILEPQPIVAVIPPPASPLCFGESTLLNIDTVYGGTGMNIFDYTYQINGNGLRFTPDQPATVFAGIQIITIEDPAGCTRTDTINITQPDEIQVIFDPAEVEVELGDSITLQPIINSSLPLASYAWTPTDSLSNAGIENPTASPVRNTRYTLTVVDENGCTATASVLVDVDFNRNVYIPNVFSPNGDGPNDEFRIFTCNGVTAIESVAVFDRWGNQVYAANDLTPECSGIKLWDGRFNGKMANPGVYVYVIEITFLDDVTLTYRGDITLLR
ncbi:MAG: gliding motility-associated C-terminal domain-containing protein [Saprospiraceae bacterium]